MIGARTRIIGGMAAALIAAGSLTVVGGAVAAPGSPGGPRYTAGEPGAGDDYFPYAGNGGYDVSHYHLDITYTPPDPAPAPIEGQLDGVATIELTATQDLDRFNLDLRGMQVRSMTVNGKDARSVAPPAPGEEVDGAAYWHVQDDDARLWELTVQPRPKLTAGQQATLVIEYGGSPAFGGSSTRPRIRRPACVVPLATSSRTRD
jgi:hypothetical protein